MLFVSPKSGENLGLYGVEGCRYSNLFQPGPGLWNSYRILELQPHQKQLSKGRFLCCYYQCNRFRLGCTRRSLRIFFSIFDTLSTVIASVTVFGIIGFKAMQSSQRCLNDYLPQLDQTVLTRAGFDQNVTTFDFFDMVSSTQSSGC